MGITKEDVAKVKGRGFLRNRGTENFSGRVVSIGGVYSAAQLQKIAECAETYGNGQVVFTSRLSAEIPGIPFEKIEAAEAFLAEGMDEKEAMKAVTKDRGVSKREIYNQYKI